MSIELNPQKERIIIRIGQRHLSFATISKGEEENMITYEPYVIKSGISIAANLREALKSAELFKTGIKRALVMLDSPVLLIPVEQFEEGTMEDMYNQSFPHKEPIGLLYNVLPELNAVAVFAINKDLKTVLDDHFADLRISTLMAPVGYFHDRKLDVFSFHQNRFKFSNQFDAKGAHDALYFLLYVWRQLLFDAEQNELHLVGELPHQEWLVGELRKYLQNVYVINPSAEFNQAPATKVEEMPFDLITLFTKGR